MFSTVLPRNLNSLSGNHRENLDNVRWGYEPCLPLDFRPGNGFLNVLDVRFVFGRRPIGRLDFGLNVIAD
jgi:hypothetical protein